MKIHQADDAWKKAYGFASKTNSEQKYNATLWYPVPIESVVATAPVEAIMTVIPAFTWNSYC